MNEEDLKQLDALLSDTKYEMSLLANASAFLFEKLEKASWVGFYLYKDNNLYLGPFQGPIACTFIPFQKGVVGTCAFRQETIIVDDVHLFPGHIACDSQTKSEIVIPIYKNQHLYAVLDIDSHELSAFCQEDALDDAANIISNKIKEAEF